MTGQTLGGGASLPIVKLGKSATQTGVATGTETALSWDTEEYDPTGMHDTVTNNSRITIATPGVYFFHAGILWLADAANNNGLRNLRFLKNAATLLAETDVFQTTDSTHSWFQQVHGQALLQAGDFIEARVLQDSSGSKSVGGANDARNFCAAYLIATL